MAGRFDPNPFDEGDEVNPFAVSRKSYSNQLIASHSTLDSMWFP